MHASDEPARRAAWSSYWQTGGLHSCIGSFAGNYDGAIGGFWRGVCATLAPGRRVLDLATGNGALPLLFWNEDPARGLAIDAIDLAALAPAWFRPDQHAGIRFHAGVDMEALPFADASFDLVCSQFGFEYARRGPALAEALRVLRPAGGLALVMHHAGSVLVEVGRSELAHQERLLAPGGLLDAAAAVMPWFARARAGADLSANAEALTSREAYNAAMRALGEAAAADRAPDLLLEARDHVHGLLGRVPADPAPALAALAGFRESLRAARLRTAELVSHALDEAQAADLVARLASERPGLRVTIEPLRQREGLLAWALRGEAGAGG